LPARASAYYNEWQTADGKTDGKWQMADGRWRSEANGARLADFPTIFLVVSIRAGA
jgi:hypothetical protein